MQQAEDTARWGNNPDIIPGMFYAFILQDAMRFELCSEEVTGRLVEAIEDCRWAELEAWLDTNRDVLLQRMGWLLIWKAQCRLGSSEVIT